jgi:GNAT superfamily N-acetyltransferase
MLAYSVARQLFIDGLTRDAIAHESGRFKDVSAGLDDLVVARDGEGQGVGSALIAKGEEWARSQRYRCLTLNVFAQNVRARDIYKQHGYGEDVMKYVKDLQNS